MQNKKAIRLTIVVIIVAALIAGLSLVGPQLFDAILAMHGL